MRGVGTPVAVAKRGQQAFMRNRFAQFVTRSPHGQPGTFRHIHFEAAADLGGRNFSGETAQEVSVADYFQAGYIVSRGVEAHASLDENARRLAEKHLFSHPLALDAELQHGTVGNEGFTGTFY